MTTANIIEIFCILDEFCNYFAPEFISVPLKLGRVKFYQIAPERGDNRVL